MQKVSKSIQNQPKSTLSEINQAVPSKIPTKQHNHPHESTLKALLIGVCIGFVFGFALEKSKVFTPELIRSQMHFTSFTMVKMFLAGLNWEKKIFYFYFYFYFILLFLKTN